MSLLRRLASLRPAGVWALESGSLVQRAAFTSTAHQSASALAVPEVRQSNYSATGEIAR